VGLLKVWLAKCARSSSSDANLMDFVKSSVKIRMQKKSLYHILNLDILSDVRKYREPACNGIY
jgi:hypothetical protein